MTLLCGPNIVTIIGKHCTLKYFSITSRLHCAAACAVASDCDAYYYEQSECHTGMAKDLIGADENEANAKSVFMNSLLKPGIN